MKKLCLLVLLFSQILLSQKLPKDTLRIGILKDISATDPHVALDTISSAVLYNVFENLVRFKRDSLDIEPSLAVRWEHSQDYRIWTYTLRKGVKFHDGTPLTPAIVANSFKYAPNFSAKVQVSGKDKVVFILPKGNANFNDFIAQPYYAIVPPIMKKDPGKVIGTGPFIYDSRVKGEKVVIRRNPNWWGGKVGIPRVEFLVYPSQDHLVEALKKQQIDLAEWLTVEAVMALKHIKYLDHKTVLGSNVGFLSMNVTRPPFTNKKVRKAVAYALDVVAITKKFFPSSSGAPAHTVIPPPIFSYMGPSYAYNPNKAKQLLKESGANLDKTVELLEAWAPRPYMPNPHGIALEIKKYLEAVGFKIKVVRDPDHYFERIKKGELDMALNGWIADSGDPVEFIAANFHSLSIGHNNVSQWSYPAFDAIIDKARVLSSYELTKALNKALRMIHEEVPAIPLFWGAQSAVWNKRLIGYHVHPSSQIMLWGVSLR